MSTEGQQWKSAEGSDVQRLHSPSPYRAAYLARNAGHHPHRVSQSAPGRAKHAPTERAESSKSVARWIIVVVVRVGPLEGCIVDAQGEG